MKYIFRILKSATELKKQYLAISIMTILLSLMSLILPLLSGWAIDEMRLGTEANLPYVIGLAVAIFVMDFLSNIMSNISGYLGDQMAARLNKILSIRYYKHLLTLPQSYFDRELSGKVINRLNRSINQITNFMNMASNNLLQFVFSTIFALVVVAFYSWPVALLLLSLYPIYIFMTLRSSGRWQRLQEKKNHHSDVATGRFAESIGQIKVVKSYLQENHELSFFRRHYQKAVDITRPQSRHWHVKDFQRRLVLNLVFLGVFVVIFVQGAQGIISPGQVVALILYAMQIRIPIFTISFLVNNTQRAISDSKDYFDIMQITPDIVDAPKAAQLQADKGKVEFLNVTFGYEVNRPVLRDISFQVRPGSKVALVGESGEGKTTLTNLLLRLYEPTEGQIKIDNQDISEVTQASLRDNIAVVFQDPALFSGTIRENIAYAKGAVKDELVVKAARAANAHEFISEFDQGYDTEIGERGLKLSGGQKQRIAIARALLKDSPILILDEATSSLDSRSEALVQEALANLMKNRTTIIIAHRLSTIEHVDQIITLKNGKIDEIGSPEVLAKSGGIYSRLLRLQGRGQTKATKRQLAAYEIDA